MAISSDKCAEMQVKITSEDGILYRGNAVSISFNSFNGQMQILPNHMPLIAKLMRGDVVVRDSSGLVNNIKCSEGFVRFNQNKCVVMIESSMNIAESKPVANAS